MIPRNWYTSVELRRGTIEWDTLATRFTQTFEFVNDHSSINVALQVIKATVFEDIPIAMTKFNQHNATIQNCMECYNVTG